MVLNSQILKLWISHCAEVLENNGRLEQNKTIVKFRIGILDLTIAIAKHLLLLKTLYNCLLFLGILLYLLL